MRRVGPPDHLPVRRKRRPHVGNRQRPLVLEPLEDRCLLTTLSVGPNTNINQPSSVGNRNETTIAIDPTDPTDAHLFAASNQSGGMFARYSSDGGGTWAPSQLTGLPTSCCDAQAAFDQFGNLFVTYIGGSNTRVLLSTDDGQTFSLIVTLGNAVDQPSIATGPGGDVAPGSVWVDWNQGSMRTAGAPVYGLGQVGSFGPTVTATQGSFGGIAVGPNGEVTLTYQNPTAGQGPATIYTDTVPSGLDGGGFSGAVPVTSTNVGGFTLIPAQPTRSVDAEANVAYDQTSGRLYLVYTQRSSVTSADTDIYVRYSDDDGTTWTDPIKVPDDSSGNSKFNDAIAVDQSTGFVAVTWYDCRNSPGNNTAQIFGTVSTDGGNTWEPNVQIGAGLSSGPAAGSSNFGDYDTMDYANGSFYRSWGDNANPSQLTPPNTQGSRMDPATARVDVTVDMPFRVRRGRGPVTAALRGSILEAPPAGTLVSPAFGRPVTAAAREAPAMPLRSEDLDAAFVGTVSALEVRHVAKRSTLAVLLPDGWGNDWWPDDVSTALRP
jgi:hypothetical protein